MQLKLLKRPLDWNRLTSLMKSISLKHVIFHFYSAVFPADVKVELTDIEEGFLVNEDPKYAEDSIKKRGQNNAYTYRRKFRTAKNEEGDYVQ